MAVRYWLGDAAAVAQVASASIDSLDATPSANTFTVAVGDASVSVAGDTDPATTAAALVAALGTAEHPALAAIAWSNPSPGELVATAAVAGVPFAAALTVSGAGSGAVTDFATTTANAGPCDLGVAANWSGGVLPSAGDTVVFDRVGSNVCYGLDALSGVGTLAHVEIRQGFTGEIGLRWHAFAKNANGTEYSTTRVREYRPGYLEVAASRVTVGGHVGPGSPAGSPMVKVKNTLAGASVCDVVRTAAAGAETGLPAVLYLASHASADVIVRDAPGGVGIGVDAPGEVATVGELLLVAGELATGAGVTLGGLTQYGGTADVRAGADVAAMRIADGALYLSGDWKVTTLEVDGGYAALGHHKTGGDFVGALYVRGGVADAQVTQEPRTIGAIHYLGGTYRGGDHVVAAAANLPSGFYAVTVGG